MPIIYAICGLQGSGKDTTADRLIQNFSSKGYNIGKMAFADRLKDTVSVLFHLDREMLAGFTPEMRKIREQEIPKWSKRIGKSITPRSLLQYIGTGLLRNQFYKDIWIDCLIDSIEESNLDIIIVTDCRYPNEIDALLKLNAKFIEIIRDEPEWVYNYINKEIIPEGIHESEYSWLKQIKDMKENKITILNDSSLKNFYEKIDKINIV